MFSFLKKDEEIQELEKILKYKNFDENTINLIFSFIYKLRDNYRDFEKIKILVPKYEKFLEKLTDILNRYIKNINFLTYQRNENYLENNVEEYTKETSTLNIYPNEKSFFNAILKLNKVDLNISNELLKYFETEIEDMFSKYFYLLFEESYNNFNAVSWMPEIKENKNEHLFIYILSWILGMEYVFNIIINEKVDLEEIFLKINKTYGTKYFLIWYESFIQLLIYKKYKNMLEKNKKTSNFNEDMKKVQEKIKENANKLNKIKEDKKEEEKVKENINKKIAEIEMALRDNKLFDLLYNTFIGKNKNKNEMNKAKYREALKEEKTKLILRRENLKIYTEEKINFEIELLNILKESLNEDNYITKAKEKKIAILKAEEYKFKINEKKEEEILFNLLKATLALKRALIQNIEEVYLLIELKIHRYILHIYGKQDVFKLINDNIKYLTDNILLITDKLLSSKKIREITQNKEINKAIILEILKTNIIDLEDVKFDTLKNENKILINIYDKEVWQAQIEINTKEETILNIKEEKKYRLFR